MTLFDTAWDLMKAPYHGTGSNAAKKIMQEGLMPEPHPRYDDFPVSWAATNLKEAGQYAQRYETESDPNDRPAIIYISDKMPIFEEHEGLFDEGKDVVYRDIVPPEMMKIVYEGRLRDEGESDEDYHKYISNDILEWMAKQGLASREEKQ